MVSFKEFKDIERAKETAHMGPGATEYQKPFGAEVHHKMHFGNPYISKFDNNPPPG